MPIEIVSNYDYQELCDELGITIEDLMSVVNKKNGLIDHFDDRDIEFNYACELFLEHMRYLHKEDKKSLHTLNQYVGFLTRFKLFIAEKNPNITISKLTEKDCSDFFKSKYCKYPLSSGTKNNYIIMLRKLISHCNTRDYTQKDYSDRFSLFKRPELLPRYFQTHQLQLILQATRNKKRNPYRDHAIITFLIATGCRVEELMNILIKDFDIENNLVFVRKGKGNKQRYIPMLPELKEVILSYMNLTKVKNWSRDHEGYLFFKEEAPWNGDRSKPLGKRTLQDVVENILKSINLEGFSTHSFRHTFAVRCLFAGLKMHELSLLLGHKDPKTTFIYTQLFPKDLLQIVADKFPFAFENLLIQITNYRSESIAAPNE
jgi:site-specific recombinase XerD